MATHNHLTALSADSFLEIISIDPSVPDPGLPSGQHRWFGLDEPLRQQRLEKAPRLTTWVVATDDLDGALAVARKAGVDPGLPVALTRGDLHWRLALHADGSLACDGVFPILIQWPAGINPVVRMQDQGVRLGGLYLTHPRAAMIADALLALGIDTAAGIAVGDAALKAVMRSAGNGFVLES